MVRRLKSSDAGYVALLWGAHPDVPTPDTTLQVDDPAERTIELGAWGEGADEVHIDSTLGLSDPRGLGFVAGWSQKKN